MFHKAEGSGVALRLSMPPADLPIRGAPPLHVIVQAGGRGSRLRHHTWNKPKCLVSVRGKPVLYHLFDRFPDARFVIIGDYAFDVLKAYLEYNAPPVDYALVQASAKGTASG